MDALISLLSTFPHLRVAVYEDVRETLNDIALGKKDEDEEDEENIPKMVCSYLYLYALTLCSPSRRGTEIFLLRKGILKCLF